MNFGNVHVGTFATSEFFFVIFFGNSLITRLHGPVYDELITWPYAPNILLVHLPICYNPRTPFCVIFVFL